MTYSDMLKEMNVLFKELDQIGVKMVGETDDAWIVKGFSDDDFDATVVVVDKESGQAHWFRVIDRHDREIAEKAVLLEIPEEYKVR